MSFMRIVFVAGAALQSAVVVAASDTPAAPKTASEVKEHDKITKEMVGADKGLDPVINFFKNNHKDDAPKEVTDKLKEMHDAAVKEAKTHEKDGGEKGTKNVKDLVDAGEKIQAKYDEEHGWFTLTMICIYIACFLLLCVLLYFLFGRKKEEKDDSDAALNKYEDLYGEF